MSTEPCRHDAAIIRAARTGDWNAELRAHLDACADCRQTTALVEQLVVLAAVTAAAAPPPRSPHVPWLRAEYARRARARTRVGRRQLAAAIAAPVVAFVGFTLVRGAEGWAHLGQSAAPVALMAGLGLVITAWVMVFPQSSG
jgi:hypothetical protein